MPVGLEATRISSTLAVVLLGNTDLVLSRRGGTALLI
jgi:hypothetical protein